MTSVFISSTSQDLADYRTAARDICIRLKLHPVAMEYFGAMPVDAVEGSKQQLAEADVYVGIFAYRYGYIPDGSNISITEIEFDYAGELGIPRLCFLVDPEYDYAWPAESRDTNNAYKLETFKARIDKTYIRERFTTVDDFALKLMHSLVQWRPTLENITPLPTGIAPPRPTLVIGRETDFDNLKSRLTSPDESLPMTVIRGWPGVGKTTLVTALAYHQEIAAAFPDGTLWAQVGENPQSALTQLKHWAESLGIGDISSDNLSYVQDILRTRLRDKRMLLIIDDIWKTEDASALQVAGPHCGVLVTTRFQDVARELVPPEDIYVLAVLSVENALELLRQLAPNLVSQFPEKSVELVNDLETLPLAIRVAGRVLEAEVMVNKSQAIKLIDELRTRALLQEKAPEDRFDPITGTTPTIRLLLQRSTDRLDEVTREHFIFLGGFAPKPATFDLVAMQEVWEVTDPLPSVRKLIDCGLLEPIPTEGRFWMHQVLVMYAQSLLTE